MKKNQLEAVIRTNKKLKGSYFHLEVEAPAIARTATPGQFVMVKVSSASVPLLRRPLGIHAVSGRNISCLYEVVGPGTACLAEKRPGDQISLLGPLGHGFRLPGAKDNARPVLVAGGMGVAPLVFLAQALAARKPLVLIGGKTRSCVLCASEFKRNRCEVKVATDDGSQGYKGFVSGLLEKTLVSMRQEAAVYACGPHMMLRAVAKVAHSAGIVAQVSLEAHMACGIGACLGCVVKTRQGLQRACHEGPVFDAADIVWDK